VNRYWQIRTWLAEQPVPMWVHPEHIASVYGLTRKQALDGLQKFHTKHPHQLVRGTGSAVYRLVSVSFDPVPVAEEGHGPERRLTEAEEARGAAMFAGDATETEVAEALGCSRSSAHRLRERLRERMEAWRKPAQLPLEEGNRYQSPEFQQYLQQTVQEAILRYGK
jgi:hypothetical protein